jgi:hypothetical protein
VCVVAKLWHLNSVKQPKVVYCCRMKISGWCRLLTLGWAIEGDHSLSSVLPKQPEHNPARSAPSPPTPPHQCLDPSPP